MRMWGINPKYLCRKHLLGEHLEMHMFRGSMSKGISMDGYIKNGLVELHNIDRRHDELAAEMSIRGYKHFSPIKIDDAWGQEGKVDVEANMEELSRRCSDCAERMSLGYFVIPSEE